MIPLSFLIIAGLSRFLDRQFISPDPVGQDVLFVTGFVYSVLAFTDN